MLTPLALYLALAAFGASSTASSPDGIDAPASALPADQQAQQARQAAKERVMTAWRQAVQPVFLDLRESSSPRDWMLASQLRAVEEVDPRSAAAARAELLRKAAAAAPDDRLVQWVAMSSMPCDSRDECAAARTFPANLDNVLGLEADNGLAWLPALRQAHQVNDSVAMESTLSRIAAATRFDDHQREFIQLLVTLYTKYPQIVTSLAAELGPDSALAASGEPDSQEEAIFTLASMQSFVMIADTFLLRRVCKPHGEPAPQARRLALCTDVGRRLADVGATDNLRRAGRDILASLGESYGKFAAAEREMNYLRWKLTMAPDQPSVMRRWREELRRTGDEGEALRATAKSLGLPTTPPAMWQLPPEFEASLLDEGMHEVPDASKQGSAE